MSLAVIVLERTSVKAVHTLVEDTLEDNMEHSGRSRLKLIRKSQRGCLVGLVKSDISSLLAILRHGEREDNVR